MVYNQDSDSQTIRNPLEQPSNQKSSFTAKASFMKIGGGITQSNNFKVIGSASALGKQEVDVPTYAKSGPTVAKPGNIHFDGIEVNTNEFNTNNDQGQ